MLRLFGRRRDEERRDELLSAYLDGELSEREQERLEARLAQDPSLRAELRALRHTMSLLRELPQVAAPRNFILSESMIERRSPAAEARRARLEPQRRTIAWAAPLLTASAAVVSLLFIVVLAGDLLLPGVGGLASAPAPMRQREAAPKIALEAAPTDARPSKEAEATDAGAADLASPPSARAEAAEDEAREEPEAAVEKEEEAVVEVTESARAPAGGGGATPSAAAENGPTEEVAALAAPTVAPTATAVSVLTPTIPAEAPVVSEEELGLLEPTPGELEVTPRLIQEERQVGRPALLSVLWRVLEVALGLASLALIVVTVQAWRLRHR